MFKKGFVIVLLGLIPMTVKAGWWRIYGGDHYDQGRFICLSPDGGYVATGVTKSFGIYANDDLWLLKFDSLGDTMWTKVYAGDYRDWGHFVTTTSDGGGYIIGGRSDFTGDDKCDMWLLKTDSEGDTLWTRHYGREDNGALNWVEETADGGYILAGQFSPSHGLGSWLIKTDENGDTLWTQTYEEIMTLTCLKPLDNGGYIILAAGVDSVTKWPAFRIQETDSLGNLLWFRQYFRGGGEFPSNFEITSDGEYVIFGMTGGEGGGAWVMKTDDAGDTLWTRIYPFMGSALCGQITEDGGLIITGSHHVDMGSLQDDTFRLALIKTDKNGTVQWQRAYGRHCEREEFGEYNCGFSVKQLSDGGYIVCGDSRDTDGSEDFYLIRTDSLGIVAIEEEPPVRHQSDWHIPISVGRQITLHYADRPQGLAATVYDASGMLVDELNSNETDGMLIWGDGAPPGVYFIVADNHKSQAHKIILIK